MNTSSRSPQAVLRQIAFALVLIPLVLALTIPFSPLAHGAVLNQAPISPVRVNQTGYLPNLPKRATVVNASASPLTWQLKNSGGTVVASGTTTVFGLDSSSNDFVHQANFSSYTTPGTGYTLVVGADVSHPFDISATVYHQMKYDALHYYYHNRSGIAIVAPYAERADLTRAAGHIGVAPNLGDTAVQPCTTFFACTLSSAYSLNVTKGWYDAGDHGKYVVNSGISVWTLLDEYERTKLLGTSLADLGDGKMNIPEKTNGVPDILDEARWNLEFMLAMQVPAGQSLFPVGMVHHKLHDVGWTGLPMAPGNDPQQRGLRPPSTAATLNLAATAAMCARIWATIDATFSNRCLTAAQTAWNAAIANPSMFAPDNDNQNGGGGYGDSNVSDDFYWAASELYITTNSATYLNYLTASSYYKTLPTSSTSMTWADTASLGTISMLVNNHYPNGTDFNSAKSNLLATADGYLNAINLEGYRVPYRPSAGYDWGSNSFVLNNMLVIALAYDLSGNTNYLNGVVDGMDYILGRNAMDKSYVSGYGEIPLVNPHHRFWAHQKDAAYPLAPAGAVSGGPNSGIQDPYAQGVLQGCKPQKCYVDNIDSWSTNEITINWNAPLAWVVAFLDEKAGPPPPTPTPCPSCPTNTPTQTPTKTSTPTNTATATPSPTLPPVVGPIVFDDFEAGNTNKWSTFTGAPGTINLTIDSVTVAVGTKAMKATYNIGAGWAGASMNFNPSQNWSGQSGFDFQFYGNNSNNQIRLELSDNSPNANNSPDAAERFEYKFTDNFTGWRRFVLPWSAFTRRADWQPTGAPNDGLTLTQMWSFNFSPLSGNSSFYLDQVQLYGSSGPTATPTNTAPATNTPTNTPIGPTNTPTHTAVSPTNTPTNTVVPPTNTPTATASGATNVALNKTATASASCNANEAPNFAVDGLTTTKWCDNSSPTKWWRVDLGANYNVTQFVIKHAAAGGECTCMNTADFTIQLSSDGTNWTTVVTVVGNTANITTHNIASTSARHVKLNITKATQNDNSAARIYEVEVWGASGPTPTPGPTNTPPPPTATPTPTNTPGPTNTPTATSAAPVNLALNLPAGNYTSSAICATGNEANKAGDGSTSTYWCSATSLYWWKVDLGANKSVNQFVIKHWALSDPDTMHTVHDYTIQVSTDNVNWTTVVTVTGNTSAIRTHNITTTTARYVKINITNPGNENKARFYEVEVWGN